jgi:condensin complex subunit 1
LAQEVINTIHTLCEKPDVLFDEIIQEMTKKIFNKEIDEQTDILAPQAPIYESNFKLAQLFFLVGHIAFKLIVHLEVLESAWKRKNQKKNRE